MFELRNELCSLKTSHVVAEPVPKGVRAFSGGGHAHSRSRPSSARSPSRRWRIWHHQDGSIEIPSATAWGTSHQLTITGNLQNAVCDQMGEHSAGASLEEIDARAGEPGLLGRSTVIKIVHEQGGRLVAAQRERARTALALASAAQRETLGSCLAVEPDEVKTKAQAGDGPQAGLDVHSGGAGGRAAVRAGGGDAGGTLPPGRGADLGAGCAQRWPPVACAG